MNKVKRWLDRRSKVTKSEVEGSPTVDDFVHHLTKELGPTACKAFWTVVKSNTPSALRNAYTGPEEKILHFANRYLSDNSFRSEVQSSLPSNFHKKMLDESMVRFTKFTESFAKTMSMSDLEQLSKSVDEKDWNRVAKKHEEDASLIVDHKHHAKQFPVHAEYAQMLKAPIKYERHKLDNNGISAKMVHEIDSGHGEDIFMAKPYHKKIEYATKSWVKKPILGWAAMATKALFNAGKIGHLAEDVSVHEHEGIPLTVHKFEPGYKHHDFNSTNWASNPVQASQIGVMDYLTNNLDRHHGNVMYGDKDATGYHQLLAIDHERNFQYEKPMKSTHKFMDQSRRNDVQKETPYAYMKGSALNNFMSEFHSHEPLVDWWNAHGQNIKDEMERQLEGIKDAGYRKHIRDNFNQRWGRMNEWAQRMAADPNGDSMYDQRSLHDDFQESKLIPISKTTVTPAQLRALPKKPSDALATLADIVNKKDKLTYRQEHMLNDAMVRVVSGMSPSESAETLRSLIYNPYVGTKKIREKSWLDPVMTILRHYSEPSFGADGHGYKYDHMNAIADMIEQLPDDKRGTLSQWSDIYRNLASERKEVA